MLIDTGFVSAGRFGASNAAQSSISVTVCQLRKRGYSLSTSWAHGYTMPATDRERLAKDAWALACMGREATSALLITVGIESMRVLTELADERGKPLREIAASCLERGIDAELSA